MRFAADSPGGPAKRRLSRRWPWAAAAAILVLGAGAFASWHFSSVVLVPDHSNRPQDIEVRAAGRGKVTLSRTEESERPGVYGINWQGGHAIVGSIFHEGNELVTRKLRDVSGYLPSGAEVAFDSTIFAGNPLASRGIPYREARVEGELGSMPAWLIPPARPGRCPTASTRSPRCKHGGQGADSRQWAIVVHGINDDPEAGLRIAPALRRMGFTSLLITYRDDLGAPSSPDGLHHLGLTEWRDLQAAVRFALRHGAEKVTLIGYSMGGALITQFMENSPLAGHISSLVLDAPVLDWRKTLSFNAEQMGLPALSVIPVEWAIDARIGADWDSLDALRHTQDFHLPILLFHGTEDDVVPHETSDDFAADLPQWVTYYAVPQAGHTQSWNVNPTLYSHRLTHFLNRLNPRANPH